MDVSAKQGDGLKRSLPEIVATVDQHQDFLGTAIVFNSKLWELLKLESITEAQILKSIDDFFIDHGVKRFPFPPREESLRLGRNPDLDVKPQLNIVEHMNLDAAGLHKIAWQYLTVLNYFLYKQQYYVMIKGCLKCTPIH